MLSHISVLVRLQRAFPSSSKLVFDYHRHVVAKRLNLGEHFEMSGWLLQDDAAVQEIFLPVMAQQPQQVTSTSSRISPSTVRPIERPKGNGGLRQVKFK